MSAPHDLTGKTLVITGATSGIGLETALRLAERGARLALVGRNRELGDAALASIRRSAPACDVQIHYADLSRAAEVRRVGVELLSALPRIDVLINNAGAIFSSRQETVDGLERTFALNHMAYFVLTDVLRERLIASAPARIVNVASEAHRGVTLDFDDLQNARRYTAWSAYKKSKLANILFTRELARHLEGTGVTANCLHPGFVASRFGDSAGGIVGLGARLVKLLFAISPTNGAKTSLHVATAPEVGGLSGRYFVKSRPAEPTAAARNDSSAARLWDESVRLSLRAGGK